jgi:Zn-dependent protease with chaperone function
MSATEMFKAAEHDNMIFTWIIRAVGAIAMFFGFLLILNPLVIVADFVPMIGSILGAGASLVSLMLTAVLAPIVIAIAWFWYRPLVGIAVLVAGGAVAYGLKHLAHRKSATQKAVPAPA